MFDTKPLLRPRQIEDTRAEISAAEEKLRSPHIEDKAEVAKQLRRLQQTFESQVPRPPETSDEEGRMTSRSKALLDQILVGMPSQEEMRKAPPGAVDKHTKWERRNKPAIMEWKNLQLRLTHGQEPEAANLERHRPTGSSLNMDNAYIPGKQYYMPPVDAALPVMFSAEQLAILEKLNPAIREQLATLDNTQRASVKDLVNTAKSAASIAGKKGAEKKKRIMSQQQKDALAKGRAEAKAKREANKAPE